jgi:N-formylglutamate amidohydrolase
MSSKSLLITIPHSGERVPTQALWLSGLPESLLMFDVDRFVDRLYAPVIAELELPCVKTEWHRYAVDLNRLPEDVDCDSVVGHSNPSGKFSRGLHWVITTAGERLMPVPMPKETHEALLKHCFEPFHRAVRLELQNLRDRGAKETFHIDVHSMPSLGTKEHRDPGERRPDVVVSDCGGKSCSPEFKELVIASYQSAGFEVAYNWPYLGGRVTETYGHPERRQHAVQVEFNRALYMNENTKQLMTDRIEGTQKAIGVAIKKVHGALPAMA